MNLKRKAGAENRLARESLLTLLVAKPAWREAPGQGPSPSLGRLALPAGLQEEQLRPESRSRAGYRSKGEATGTGPGRPGQGTRQDGWGRRRARTWGGWALLLRPRTEPVRQKNSGSLSWHLTSGEQAKRGDSLGLSPGLRTVGGLLSRREQEATTQGARSQVGWQLWQRCRGQVAQLGTRAAKVGSWRSVMLGTAVGRDTAFSQGAPAPGLLLTHKPHFISRGPATSLTLVASKP